MSNLLTIPPISLGKKGLEFEEIRNKIESRAYKGTLLRIRYSFVNQNLRSLIVKVGKGSEDVKVYGNEGLSVRRDYQYEVDKA